MASCSETMRQCHLCHPHHQYLLFLMMTTVTLLLTISMAAPSQESSSLQRQASILLDIKQRFEFPNPTLDTWNLSNYKSLCSSWTGVQCGNDHHDNHSVVSLDIPNLNLSGTVSPSIAQLTSLQTLSLANNNFSGQFPSEILHNLSNLQFLNISTNQFTGELSSSWGMNNLLSLDVYDNNFDGSLPLSILNLTNLHYLDLSGNFFSGSIPPAYGKMESLTYLSLAGNDLNGTIPSHLGNLRNLTQLRLGYYNSFSGGIPVELGNITNLAHLDLANCGLTGPIPAELGQLHNLDTLFLQFNQLTGPLPKELGTLTALRFFDVSNNLLTGEIPVELSGLGGMTVMNLFMNKFHGQIPGFVAEWRELRVLQLWRNNFTGSIPRKLGRNGNVEEVDLSSNKLTGLVPEWLCYGGKLRILILLNNFVFGSLPNSLGRCESLVRVRLGQNYLSGDIPNGLLYLPHLSFLELQDNYITGGIGHRTGKPSSSSGSKLTLLNLSNNRLSGPLPDSIGNLSSLKTVLLSGNNFSGEIPSRIGELRDMIKLDLSRNNLSSGIPPELGKCSELSLLELSQNQFSGPIPVQLSRIRVLGYLNVSWNKLTGKLPSEIGSMKSLTSADFSHNNFSGSVPETGQFPLFNSTSFDGNPFLCGFSSKPCSGSGTQPSTTTLDHQLHTKPPLLLSGRVKLVIALGLFIFSLLFAIFAINKTKIWRSSSSNSWKLTSFQNLTFRTDHILQCLTDGNIIGQGGAGIVYRGITPTGEYIAVKKLFNTTATTNSRKNCYHNDHGLSAEIQTLGKIRHRNIVRLLAFCTNKKTKTNLLVYEYMPNGSLGEILHGGGKTLKWEFRLKIAIEAAKGLCYLHHDCDPLIIHRDVKANNILISDEFEAHVADFGLAKFLQHGSGNGGTECMSAIAGSYGYIAPEYAYTLKVDEKSDVYSFGVVLLELITGRRPVGDFGEEGLLDIVQWSKMQTGWNKEKVVNIIDKRLQQQQQDEVVVPIPIDEAAQVFFVAMLCVQEHSIERPTMREVVQMLVQAKQPDAFGMD